MQILMQIRFVSMAKSIDFYGFFVVYWGAMSPTHSLECVKNYKKAGQNSRNL